MKHPDELNFLSTKALLKDAMPPQPPPVYWKHQKENDEIDFAITAGSINIITSDSTSTSVQLSLRIATQVAMTTEPVIPTRGVNPFTQKNESEDYDKMLASEARPLPVLYINTIMTDAQLEQETIGALPEMLEWIWLGRDRGAAFPYESMDMRSISASMGTLMKEEQRNKLTQFVRQNKIKLVVLNSFEFACRTQREKDDMMALLKELRDLHGVAVVVFTHETVARLRTATRGALPMLAKLADFVTSVSDLAPDITPRKIEYVAPVVADVSREPVYVEKTELVDALRNASEETMWAAVSLMDDAPDLPGLPRMDFDIHRNGNPPMKII